jgi:uncharacterized protein
VQAPREIAGPKASEAAYRIYVELGVSGCPPAAERNTWQMSIEQQVPLVLIVVVLAAVQSVFGVGLLVFGTPTLLVLGYPFEQILAILLPCSIVISLLQVITGGGFTLEPIRRRMLIFTAPTVLLGTMIVLSAGGSLDIKAIVGVMLIVTALLRISLPVQRRMEGLVRRWQPGFLTGLGVIHGVSNLGGGILTFIVGSSFERKEDVRRHIAFCYGMMASIQLGALLLTSSPGIAPHLWILLPLLAGTTYLVVGQRLFRSTGQAVYQWSLTGLIGTYGVLLLVRV